MGFQKDSAQKLVYTNFYRYSILLHVFQRLSSKIHRICYTTRNNPYFLLDGHTILSLAEPKTKLDFYFLKLSHRSLLS